MLLMMTKLIEDAVGGGGGGGGGGHAPLRRARDVHHGSRKKRVDARCGTATPLCFRAASAPAPEALWRSIRTGTRHTIERMKRPEYPRRSIGNGIWNQGVDRRMLHRALKNTNKRKREKSARLENAGLFFR